MQASSCLTIAAGISIIVMIMNKSRSIIDISLRRAWLAMVFKRLDSNSLNKNIQQLRYCMDSSSILILELWFTITSYLQNFVYNLSPSQRQHINYQRNGEVGKDKRIHLQNKFAILFNSFKIFLYNKNVIQILPFLHDIVV